MLYHVTNDIQKSNVFCYVIFFEQTEKKKNIVLYGRKISAHIILFTVTFSSSSVTDALKGQYVTLTWRENKRSIET